MTGRGTSAADRLNNGSRSDHEASDQSDSALDRPGIRAERMREVIERTKGTVLEEFFATSLDGAAALIREPRRHWYDRHRFHIDVSYDNLHAEPELDQAVRTVRREERQSSVLLRGRAHQIVTQDAYALVVHLLNTLDASCRSSEDAAGRQRAAAEAVGEELRRLDTFGRAAARRSALGLYLLGLPIGAVAGIVLVMTAFQSQNVGVVTDPRLVSFCLAAGAIGAVISVMVRVSRGTTLEVDFARGRIVTLLAGSFRPVIGAVFGAALYVLVLGGLLPIRIPAGDGPMVTPDHRSELFFIGLSFLAGFSERWAQDTIVSSAPKVPAERMSDTDESPTT